jgi:hypothetical protein
MFPKKSIYLKKVICWPCLQSKDIVFSFIIEYSSLMDFGP